MSLFPELDQVRKRLDQLRSAPDSAREPLLQELELLYEELEASDDELRSQQDHIDRLIQAQDQTVRQQERMLWFLPMPLLVTDRYGVIRAANAPASDLFAVPIERLVDKPVFALVEPASRPELRTRLAEYVASGVATRCRAVVTHRGGESREVDVSLAPTPGVPGTCTWALTARDTGGPGTEHGYDVLPDILIALAALANGAPDIEQLVDSAAGALRSLFRSETIGDRISATIAVGPPGGPDAVSSTDAHAQRLDGAQVSAGEGPSMAAFATRTTQESADLVRDERWPRLTRHLAEEDGSGTVAVPLEVGDRLLGVLTLYRRHGSELLDLPQTARLLGAAVAAAIHEVHARGELCALAENLREALRSRAGIEQAKGILMAQSGCDAEQAFARLVSLSSTQHLKLRDVAQRIVDASTRSGETQV
jgi:PAS domain-containing protein